MKLAPACLAAACLAGLTLLAACSSDSKGADGSTDAPVTTAAPDATSATTDSVSGTTDGGSTNGSCGTITEIPAGAPLFNTVQADLNDDGNGDTVTAWSDENGVSHVFVEMADGTVSDVALASSYDAETTSVSTEDFFYDGTDTARPLVIVAASRIDAEHGAGEFLQVNAENGCVGEWGSESEVFTFNIDRAQGLTCDGGVPAGPSAFYILTLEDDGAGNAFSVEYNLTVDNFKVELTELYRNAVDPSNLPAVGDIQNCVQQPILG